MSKVPPLLEPLLGRLPPEAALVVVTSVLGASANWLVLRWVYALLGGRRREDEGEDGDGVAVVLVSFMRDEAFWREGGARMGLDLDAHARAGRFVLVDGLSALFAPRSAGPGGGGVLGSAGLDDVRRGIEDALGGVRGRATVLVVDQVDALLAAAGPGDGVTSLAVQNMLLSLRERVHATILTLAADDALLHGRRGATRLEREHAALVLSQAHAARAVVGLRMLDTGAARDVSGVVRVAVRADDDDDARRGGWAAADAMADVEYLYHVAGDGAVRVFERGA
ncbi:elongation complex protein 6 domain-containing protein [Hirsutella rhossiliensis]|uniref:Elongation complex protein 6 domain-containing protein n=1 Tax=Hirsutella rhossiliensis TaxID=111463 RepID=A0A9P8N000_9HYPO|nr:elongation complex protein 6 domain-containing protein [Hirsutella rhossiliensis]KAH0964344.1 elongation complex protein 6 domain-containing protein [Hirsutella rhossiliensis]